MKKKTRTDNRNEKRTRTAMTTPLTCGAFDASGKEKEMDGRGRTTRGEERAESVKEAEERSVWDLGTLC